MLNNKISILVLLAFVCLSGCRIQTIPFNSTKMNSAFFKNVPALWGSRSITGFDSITVYRAPLQEELVDRDGLPEFKLMNEESKQPRADLVGRKNHNELFLCQVYTGKNKDRLCVFIASSYDADNKCTKLGPAYLGVIRMGQMNLKKALTIKQSKDSTYFIAAATATNLLFIAERNIPVAYETLCNVDTPSDSLCYIRIKEIINSNTNKIGGKKPTLYSTQKVFSDPDALLFKYYKTIKN
jgi:hypothetical protein